MSRTSVVVIAIVIVAALAGAVLYYHYSYGTVEVYVQGDPSFAVYITVSSVMLHSESGGWITLSNSSTTVQLTNSPQLLTSSTIPAGNYTELRMVVSSAEVTVGPVNVTASVPSGILKIPIIKGGLHVTGGSTAKLEVLMGPHLVSTGNGQYMLSPVVTAEQVP
ncbi:MAG: DUF4382 domain-containing protein [Conexivisphaerales archaeon]|nr:DUF4382 domain-containing protein [Conexivisphaerales archaeon]